MMVVCADFVGDGIFTFQDFSGDFFFELKESAWRAKAVFLAPDPRSTLFSHLFVLFLNESLGLDAG